MGGVDMGEAAAGGTLTQGGSAGVGGSAGAGGIGSEWREANHSGLFGRIGFATSWTGSRFLVLWGEADNFDRSPLGDGASYDPVEDAWDTFTPPFGEGRVVAATCGRFLVATFENDSLVAYDAEADEWSQDPLPSKLHNQLAIACNDTTALIFGMTEAEPRESSGFSYDLEAQSWEALPTDAASPSPSPSPRRLHGAAVANDKLVVWGGMDPEGALLGDGAVLDLSSGVWRTMSAISAPDKRLVPRLISTGSAVIVWGGEGKGDGKLYDVAADSWRDLPMLPGDGQLGVSLWLGEQLFVYENGTEARGGLLSLSAPTWGSISLDGPPVGGDLARAAWTGTSVIVQNRTTTWLWTPPRSAN